MSKLSLLVYLNAYEDRHSSNAPNRSNFKWERDINSILVSNPNSLAMELAPGETRALWNGERALTQDGTTQYSISLVPFSTTTYQLAWTGGTNPTFRTARATGADASTQVTVTLNGTVLTFSSTGGTSFNLISGGVVVGDYVQIGNLFNAANQGTWQIIAVTATSFSVVNPVGVAEGPYTLGSGFASQVSIYSAAGVQVGDTLSITGGFSPVTQGSYTVTAVSAQNVQFSSVGVLPQQGPITTEDITFYFMAKKLVYVESDQHITMLINGVSGDEIVPDVNCVCAGSLTPGLFLRTSIMYSMSVTNVSINTAHVFFATVE
jgi:hypothetical protein